jgi:hypothetical protein
MIALQHNVNVILKAKSVEVFLPLRLRILKFNTAVLSGSKPIYRVIIPRNISCPGFKVQMMCPAINFFTIHCIESLCFFLLEQTLLSWSRFCLEQKLLS